MYYIINKSALIEKVKEEVSKVADEAYSEDGVALYDSVVITEKDIDQVNRFIDDAVSLLVRRAFDITKYAPLVTTTTSGGSSSTTTTTVTPRLQFYVPDFDLSMTDAVADELDKYITLYVSTALFQSRRASVVPEYTSRTQDAMDTAITLLKSRKSPITTVSW